MQKKHEKKLIENGSIFHEFEGFWGVWGPPGGILGVIFDHVGEKVLFVSVFFFMFFLNAKMTRKWSQMEAKMEAQIMKIAKKTGLEIRCKKRCEKVRKWRPSDPRKSRFRVGGVAKITKTGGLKNEAKMEPKWRPKGYQNHWKLSSGALQKSNAQKHVPKVRFLLILGVPGGCLRHLSGGILVFCFRVCFCMHFLIAFGSLLARLTTLAPPYHVTWPDGAPLPSPSTSIAVRWEPSLPSFVFELFCVPSCIAFDPLVIYIVALPCRPSFVALHLTCPAWNAASALRKYGLWNRRIRKNTGRHGSSGAENFKAWRSTLSDAFPR